MNDDTNGQEVHSEGPLTSVEVIKLRRLLEDDQYRKRIRKTMKIWLYTVGTTASMMAAGLTAWKEFAARFWK